MVRNMIWWRGAWGKLGDAVAELSSVRELLEKRKEDGRHLGTPQDDAQAYATLSEEIRMAEQELADIKRLVRELRRPVRDKAAVRSR